MKLAVICGGKTQLVNEHPLEYISDSIDRVIETLEANGWKCIPFKKATTEEEYKKLFIDDSIEDITDFLFYYIGHGRGNNISTFEILFDGSSLTLEQIKLRTKEALSEKLPKKMAVVIDACYSGNAIDKNSRVSDVEILTARDRDTQAFEKMMPDGNGWSEFSYYFCKIFETVQKSPTLDLKQIGKYIAAPEQTNEDTFYLPHPSSLIDKIVIGHHKEIKNLRDTLNKYFSNVSMQKYKENIFEYLHNQSSNFNKLLKAKTFNEVTTILLRENQCLFCLLKKLNENTAYIEDVENDFDCETLYDKAQDSRYVTKVILKIELEANTIEKCRIGGWKRDNTNTYKALEFSKSDVNFSENAKVKSYKEELPAYLLKIFDGKKPIAKIELQLILPYKLFTIDFNALEFNFQIQQTWIKAFRVSKRFLSNYDNYYVEDEVHNWKENSDKYSDIQDSPMDDSKLLEIDSIDKFDDIDMFNDRDYKYILLTSNYSLSDEEKLIEICYYGIPHAISPLAEEFDVVNNIDFRDKKVVDMQENLYSFIRNNRRENALQFICDDYNDVAFMGSDIAELDNIEEL